MSRIGDVLLSAGGGHARSGLARLRAIIRTKRMHRTAARAVSLLLFYFHPHSI